MNIGKAGLKGGSIHGLSLPATQSLDIPNSLSATNRSIARVRNGQIVSVPDSLLAFGVGPQNLIHGTADLGYFGRLPSSELFTSIEFIETIGYTDYLSIRSNGEWLKFAYNGKILYCPKGIVASGPRWESLYADGLVYRTDDVGVKSKYNDTTVNQLRTIEKDRYRYKVGLFSMQEWVDLLVPTSDSTGTWDNISDGEFLFSSGRTSGKYQWVQGVYAGMPRYRGGHSVIFGGYGYDMFVQGTTTGWRPLLELIQ